jgi:transcription elongation factor Elf1
MKRSRYMAEILKRQRADNTFACENCGKHSLFNHAVIDHDQNTTRVLCDDCFQVWEASERCLSEN